MLRSKSVTPSSSGVLSEIENRMMIENGSERSGRSHCCLRGCASFLQGGREGGGSGRRIRRSGRRWSWSGLGVWGRPRRARRLHRVHRALHRPRLEAVNATETWNTAGAGAPGIATRDGRAESENGGAGSGGGRGRGGEAVGRRHRGRRGRRVAVSASGEAVGTATDAASGRRLLEAVSASAFAAATVCEGKAGGGEVVGVRRRGEAVRRVCREGPARRGDRRCADQHHGYRDHHAPPLGCPPLAGAGAGANTPSCAGAATRPASAAG